MISRNESSGGWFTFYSEPQTTTLSFTSLYILFSPFLFACSWNNVWIFRYLKPVYSRKWVRCWINTYYGLGDGMKISYDNLTYAAFHLYSEVESRKSEISNRILLEVRFRAWKSGEFQHKSKMVTVCLSLTSVVHTASTTGFICSHVDLWSLTNVL